MGGYSCMRKSRYSHVEVYGQWQIPTSYAGKYDATNSEKNIVPEMFYGFYKASGSGYGLDIGLYLTQGGSWKPFSNRLSTIYPSGSTAWVEGPALALTPGERLYCKAWIAKSGNNYYSYFNVSRKSYNGTDLLSTPCCWQISNSFGADVSSGYMINREIVIAANSQAGNFETSGCYLYNGKFLSHGLVSSNGTTYVWTDDNSHGFSNVSGEKFVIGTGNRRILRLRNENKTVSDGIISASRTDSSSGATETVQISYVP